MHTDPLAYHAALVHNREAQERARLHRLARQARASRRAAASGPHGRRRRGARRLRPIGEAA